MRSPAFGSCLKTRPAGVERLGCCLTCGTKPSAEIFARAAASRMFRYSSTGTGAFDASLLLIWL
jgi:hypothetical protein